ncbi:MAG: hypothetical protein AB7V50_01450 [Vampirovibrionia bacterium]
MSNKKSLLLALMILFVGISFINPVEAKRVTSKDESQLQSETAGVQGSQNEALRALSNPEVARCKSDVCVPLKAKIEALNADIEKSISSYCNSINSYNLKKANLSKDEKKQLESLKKEVESLKKKNSEEFETKREELFEKFAQLDDKNASAFEGIKTNIQERVKLNDELLEAAQNMDSSFNNENEDQVDVELQKQSYLQNGELVAFGIPGIPHIPTPKINTSKSSNSSKSSNASSQPAQQPVSDAGYNALRSVETASDKVTDSEKDQFLTELGSRSTSSSSN